MSINPSVSTEIIQIDYLLNLYYLTSFQPCGSKNRLTVGFETFAGRQIAKGGQSFLNCLRSRNGHGGKSICISLCLYYTYTFVCYKIKDSVLGNSLWEQLGYYRSWTWVLGVILVYNKGEQVWQMLNLGQWLGETRNKAGLVNSKGRWEKR